MLVGRDEERATLAAALAAAREGAGGATVLVGDPGIGKTTLLQWLQEQASDATVVEARGVESEAELPYAALVDLLTPLIDRLDALPETQKDVLATALAIGPPGGVDRFAVGVATLGLIAASAEERLLVLIVDDLQWIDSASRDALAFVTRRLASLPVIVVGAERSSAGVGESLLPGAAVVRVGPLDPSAALQLLGDGIAPAVVKRLLDAARGNPLALVELPQSLTTGQLDGSEPLIEPMATRNGLERAFASRLAPLSPDGRRAVLVAAADGSRTAGVVLAALASFDLAERALAEVESLGLVSLDANRIEFRHPLVRSAAYHGADPAERRLVHAALADADDDPDRSVWHRAAATVGSDADVAAELEEAAKRALGRGAFGPSAAAFERSAALTPDRATRGVRLVYASNALEELGNLQGSQSLLRDAVQLVDEPVAHARVIAQIASVRMASGDVETGHAMLLEEAVRIEAVSPVFAAGMLALAANLLLYRLQVPDTVALMERAFALGDPGRERLLHERIGLAFGRVLSGEHTAMVELAREAAADRGHGHRLSSAVGWPLVWTEEYDAARQLLAWAIAVQREGGALRYLPQSLHPLAELDYRVGRWIPALAEAHEAIALFEETGQPMECGFARATASRIEAALGHQEECRAHARDAFAADATAGMLFATGYASSALGFLELGAGDPEAAIAALDSVERITHDGQVQEPWVFQSAPDLIEACSRAGQGGRAWERLELFHAQAEATGRISARAAAARCRGMLAEDYQGPFEAALELHARVPTPFERARTSLAYGERLRRDGRRAEARERLHSALQDFDRLGARPWSERARVELRASGQTVRTPDQRAADDLTPQELQVAALVAGGATNREAAATLFLSAKTIEFHLGNVYRKLGIRSRTELARIVEPASP
jgi:DNA-binding CsgD family transcriptional regulator/DNA replicative helicase MCM subunit Mcm2 (Cdc46/Mcm family)